jgi:hypothetical protein
MRSSYRTRRFEGSGSIFLVLGAILLGLVILGVVGLGVYGSSLSPSQKPVEQEISDSFPR